MDWGSAETWSWIWLVATVVFALGEMGIAGSFFLAPFAAGAAVASISGFLGAPVGVEWLLFLAVSGGSFLALRPLARRMNQQGPMLGIGSHRQVGQTARVVEAIDGSTSAGTVMLGSERWRAESTDGTVIPIGAHVAVIEVRGTRLLVRNDPTVLVAGPAETPTAD